MPSDETIVGNGCGDTQNEELTGKDDRPAAWAPARETFEERNGAARKREFSQREQNVTATQNDRPGAVAVGAGAGLSNFERHILAKQQGRNPGTSDVPGSRGVLGAHPTTPASDPGQLSQLERDVAAKQRAAVGRTGASAPGARHTMQGEVTRLERDFQAKQRPAGGRRAGRAGAAPYVPGAVRRRELAQLEHDVKVAGNVASPTPGAYPASAPGSQPAGQAELTQLETNISAKQRARPVVDAEAMLIACDPTVSGVQRTGGRDLAQLEREIAAKLRARPAPAVQAIPGAQPSGQKKLTKVELDVQAKQQARPREAAQAAGVPSAGERELSQLEHDIAVKQRVRPVATQGAQGAQPAEPKERTQLELQTTQKARQIGGAAATSTREQIGHTQPSRLEPAVTAKNRAKTAAAGEAFPGAHAAAGGGRIELSSFESDVMTKNQATANQQGALTSGGRSQLSSAEQDVLENRPVRLVDASGVAMTTSPGTQLAASNSGLCSLERDAMAKNQMRSPHSSVPGSTCLSTLEQDLVVKSIARPPAVPMGVTSGETALSNLERDVAEKNRARPSPLSATGGGAGASVIAEAAVSDDLSVLDNTIIHKSPHAPPLSESPLFINAASTTGRSMYEISRLDERIAQKSGVLPQQKSRQTHDEVGSNDYYDSSYEDENDKIDASRKPGYNEDGGVERARDDKGYIDNRPAGEVGITEAPPGGDHEYGEMDLAVATAIEEDEDDMFIPAAVEYDPDAKPPMYKNRRFRMYGIAGFFCLIAVVVVAVVITQVSSTGGYNGPTMAPTTFRESLGIEQQIAEVFGSEYLADENSIQSKAVDWIVNGDPYQIEPDAENLIQRFIMVFFYFETSQQGPWKSCGPPEGTQRDNCYYYFLTDTLSEPWRYQELHWTRWLTGKHECDWAGVTCHSEKVTDISLDGYELSGSFPKELTKLDYLRDISLTHNRLTGTLPRELAEMKHLTDIELQRNAFKGTIPHDWFGAKNLIHINFATNQITGSIPSEFGKLTDLQRFFFQNNQLTGSLPMELYDMTSLKWMFIGNNKFSGSIASEVGQLTNLEYFFVEGNPMTGSIPSEFGQLTEIRELDFHDTSMSGSVPEELYTELWELVNMYDFTSAQFTGTISTNIGLMHTIDWFLYGDNKFTGTIPMEAAEMSALHRFQVHGNNLTGSIPVGLCAMRGDNGLKELFADCAQTSNGETPVLCPSGCCTECCNQDTGICLPAS